mmetsp:Transcript_54617/g.130470  ORF Transcript_54617/g.130470 Transcript_54617/m.130470 type:complete len:207 (-) Transcript_54617:991-1611(-)
MVRHRFPARGGGKSGASEAPGARLRQSAGPDCGAAGGGGRDLVQHPAARGGGWQGVLGSFRWWGQFGAHGLRRRVRAAALAAAAGGAAGHRFRQLAPATFVRWHRQGPTPPQSGPSGLGALRVGRQLRQAALAGGRFFGVLRLAGRHGIRGSGAGRGGRGGGEGGGLLPGRSWRWRGAAGARDALGHPRACGPLRRRTTCRSKRGK